MVGVVSEREYDLPELGIAEHVGMRLGYPLKGKRTVEYRFERTHGKCTQQLCGEPFATDKRLLYRTGTERDTDDARAFARDVVKVTVAHLTCVASDAHQSPFDRQDVDIIGKHRPTDVIDDHINPTLVCRCKHRIDPICAAGVDNLRRPEHP